MSSSYQKALEAGYSPEEINAYLSKKHPKFQEALNQGYKPEEVSDYLDKKKEPKESLGSNIGRQVGRTGARVAETVLGAPRAFGEFLESVVPEKAIGQLAGKLGLQEPVEKGFEFAKRNAPYKLFPESQQIRKDISQGLFGKKLEPKNEWERKADDLISDFAALALPISGSKLKFLKPALLALGGTVASEGIEALGGTEKQKTYGKIGTILAGSFINPKGADKLSKDLYSQARSARPIDAKVSGKKLNDSVDNLEKQLKKGDPSAGSKRKSISLINDIKSKIKNGEIEVEELEQFKRDINEARSGLFEEFKVDKVGRKSAKRNLDTVSKYVDNALKEYGKTNPEWEAFYRPANEVHGAIANSKRARNWVIKNMKSIGFPALAGELGLYHFVSPAAAGVGLTGVGLGAAGVGASEVLSRVMKSPTLRKYYTNAMTGALKEDAVVVHENLKKIDQELRKEKK